MSTMLESIGTTTIVDVDIEIDLPWITVARLTYPNMTRVDLRTNQNADADELNMIRDRFIPLKAVVEVAAYTIDPKDFLLVDSTMETEWHYWFMESATLATL